MNIGSPTQIAGLVAPVDLAAGAVAASYVSLKGSQFVAILVQKAAGGAAEMPTFTVTQATAIAGTGAKALNFDRVLSKVPKAADWTTIVKTLNNTFTPAAGNVSELYLIILDAAKLDVANGFDCIGVAISDPGTTPQLCSVLALLGPQRYGAFNQIAPGVD